jgi:AcrR family transcriptional regulator
MNSNGAGWREHRRYQQRRRDLARELLLDGARDHLHQQRWDRLRMHDVAEAAGIHRSSLYTEFGTRERLLRTLAARELERVVDAALGRLGSHGGAPRVGVEAALSGFLADSAENGFLIALLRGDSHELRTVFDSRRSSMCARLSAGVDRVWPALESAEANQVAELMLRSMLSVAFQPGASPRRTCRHFAEILGCYLERAVAPPRAAERT